MSPPNGAYYTDDMESVDTASSDHRDEVLRDDSMNNVVSPPPTADEMILRKKQLVQQTWGIVEAQLGQEVTMIFYQRLCEKHPEVLPMFDGTDMSAQSKKLYEMLRVAIRYLDRIEEFLPTLRDMGVRHKLAYGVQREHYSAVTDVFIETMNDYLDDALRPLVKESMPLLKVDIAAAWAWILTLIGNTMADAGDAATTNTKARGLDTTTTGVAAATAVAKSTAATMTKDDDN